MERYDWDSTKGEAGVEVIAYRTHECSMQGNVNPIEFGAKGLQAERYPTMYGLCDSGDWLDTDPYVCLAFTPRSTDVIDVDEYRDYLYRLERDFRALTRSISVLTCLRCGGKWYPRGTDKPRTCPKCGSPYWDIPRKPVKVKNMVSIKPSDMVENGQVG